MVYILLSIGTATVPSRLTYDDCYCPIRRIDVTVKLLRFPSVDSSMLW